MATQNDLAQLNHYRRYELDGTVRPDQVHDLIAP